MTPAILLIASQHMTPTCLDCTHKDAIALAQVVAHEARFDSWPDALGIYEVLYRTRAIIRAKSKGKGSLAYAANAYSGIATGSKLPTSDLDSWSSELPRTTNREFWILVERAETLFRSPEFSPCLFSEPRHWGGPMDRPRARRMGFQKIQCGSTKNDFYILPSARSKYTPKGNT